MLRKFGWLVVSSIILFSCARVEDYYYFSGVGNEEFQPAAADTAALKYIIQPGDQLSIVVSSSSPELTLLFNSSNAGGSTNIGASGGSSGNIVLGYLVDSNGEIAFPQLGNVRVVGLSTVEIQELLEEELTPLLKNVVVNARVVNFRISVLGEVARPGMYNVSYERINVIQGLAFAGDLTIFGQRETVLLIREVHGKRTTHRLNLNDRSILTDPNYYLKNGDILYVEPNRTRVNQSRTFFQVWPTVTSAVTLLILVLNNLRN
jgi:polysaccharide export outer membrane protein